MKRRPMRKTRREFWLWLAASAQHRALNLCEMPGDAALITAIAKASEVFVEARV